MMSQLQGVNLGSPAQRTFFYENSKGEFFDTKRVLDTRLMATVKNLTAILDYENLHDNGNCLLAREALMTKPPQGQMKCSSTILVCFAS